MWYGGGETLKNTSPFKGLQIFFSLLFRPLHLQIPLDVCFQNGKLRSCCILMADVQECDVLFVQSTRLHAGNFVIMF